VLRDRAVLQLCRIFAAEVVPKRLYFCLLRKVLLWEKQAHPLVLKNPPCMDLAQASQLQGCLEEPKALKELPPPKAELSVMRIILAQSLARAAIMAAQQ